MVIGAGAILYARLLRMQKQSIKKNVHVHCFKKKAYNKQLQGTFKISLSQIQDGIRCDNCGEEERREAATGSMKHVGRTNTIIITIFDDDIWQQQQRK